VLELLEPDDYGLYLSGFLRAGMRACQGYWRYADICSACWAAAMLIKPRRYLEIGVRRGRSMSMVAMAAPGCDIIGFDMWLADYAGMQNPGKEFVAAEVAKTGHTGRLEFVDGDSHVTLSEYFSQNPDVHFDLVTVDGDHSEEGAAQDLAQVLPRISVGGVVVFDDIAHPQHPYLASVWRRAMAAHESYRDWTFDELGFGVALAMRMK
jgi:predicted O-methyltransferase YrrM